MALWQSYVVIWLLYNICIEVLQRGNMFTSHCSTHEMSINQKIQHNGKYMLGNINTFLKYVLFNQHLTTFNVTVVINK